MLLLLFKPGNAHLITYGSETPPNAFLFIINFHFQVLIITKMTESFLTTLRLNFNAGLSSMLRVLFVA